MHEPLQPTQATAAGEFYLRHAENLATRLQREFHWVHEDELSEAVVEAILAAAHDSRDFDSARCTFEQYLIGHARDHVRTRLRSEKRRKAREEKKATLAVTASEPAAPSLQIEDDEAERSLVQELLTTLAHTEAERTALSLWMQGIDAPADVSLRLGYGTDPDAVRRAGTLLARLRQRIHREKLRRQPREEKDSP